MLKIVIREHLGENAPNSPWPRPFTCASIASRKCKDKQAAKTCLSGRTLFLVSGNSLYAPMPCRDLRLVCCAAESGMFICVRIVLSVNVSALTACYSTRPGKISQEEGSLLPRGKARHFNGSATTGESVNWTTRHPARSGPHRAPVSVSTSAYAYPSRTIYGFNRPRRGCYFFSGRKPAVPCNCQGTANSGGSRFTVTCSFRAVTSLYPRRIMQSFIYSNS